MQAYNTMNNVDRVIDRLGVALLVVVAVFAPLSTIAFLAAL
jgi:hypothetical protein